MGGPYTKASKAKSATGEQKQRPARESQLPATSDCGREEG